MRNPDFYEKYPTLATLFWDVTIDKLTDKQQLDLINQRYDNLIFWELTDNEWQYLFNLETQTGEYLYFLTEKTFYLKGFYKKHYDIYKKWSQNNVNWI